MESKCYAFIIALISCAINANAIFARSSGEIYHHGNNLSESSETVLGNHDHLEKTDLQVVPCRCENGSCEKDAKGNLVCKCPPEFGVDDSRCKPCNCGKDANCTFSFNLFSWGTIQNCICKEGYKESGSKCIGSCSPNPCKNGGVCRLIRDEIQCKCPNQYSGELCKTTRCEKKCGGIEGGVKCTGEQTTDETTICGCDVETKVYVQEDKKCIDCECKNVGICVINNTCSCLNGTSGNKCEVVNCDSVNPGCENSGGICKYSVKDQASYCNCPETKVFHSMFKRCEGSCIQIGCENEGTCSNTGMCVCLPNTSGQRCETVNCSSLYEACEVSGGKCKYNNRQSKLICECPPFKVFNQTSTRCEGWCTDICGNHSGVECDGDQTSYDRTICGCKDKSEIYVKEVKKCINACKSNPCQNGGSCSPEGLSFRCCCETFFSGSACETDNRNMKTVFVGLAQVFLMVVFFISNSCFILKIIHILKRNSQNSEEWKSQSGLS